MTGEALLGPSGAGLAAKSGRVGGGISLSVTISADMPSHIGLRGIRVSGGLYMAGESFNGLDDSCPMVGRTTGNCGAFVCPSGGSEDEGSTSGQSCRPFMTAHDIPEEQTCSPIWEIMISTPQSLHFIDGNKLEARVALAMLVYRSTRTEECG